MTEDLNQTTAETSTLDIEDKEGNDTIESVSKRKTVAFSDLEMRKEVDVLFTKKPEGWSNADFLYHALRRYVEYEETKDTLQTLPTRAAELFQGDLQRLDIAFETIKETYRTQMLSVTQLVEQQENRLKAQHEKEKNTEAVRFTQLQTQYEAIEQELARCQQQAQQREAQTQRYEQLQREFDTTTQLLAAEQRQRLQLEADIKQQDPDQLKSLMAQLQQLTQQNQELTTQMTQLKAEHTVEVQHLKQENQGLTQQLTDTKQQLTARLTEMKEQQQQLKSLTEIVQTLSSQTK